MRVFSISTILFCVGVMVSTGCTPAQSQGSIEATVAVAIALTSRASVTDTPQPTNTPTITPSATATSTSTPSPTSTSTNTPTATPTDTPTPLPPGPVTEIVTSSLTFKGPDTDSPTITFLHEGDRVAIVEQTEDSLWLKVQLLDTANNVGRAWILADNVDLDSNDILSEIPVATMTPIPTETPIPTATPIPTSTPDIRGDYSEIDIRELDSYGNKYLGDKVRLRGKVFNILDDGLQMWVRIPGGGSFDNVAVVVTWISDDILPDQVYENTYITVYGRVIGTFEGTNAYGGSVSQPLIYAEIIEK
ncbi:MAG: SH3 domain-containing protein [Chloroflexota bacterium]